MTTSSEMRFSFTLSCVCSFVFYCQQIGCSHSKGRWKGRRSNLLFLLSSQNNISFWGISFSRCADDKAARHFVSTCVTKHGRSWFGKIQSENHNDWENQSTAIGRTRFGKSQSEHQLYQNILLCRKVYFSMCTIPYYSIEIGSQRWKPLQYAVKAHFCDRLNDVTVDFLYIRGSPISFPLPTILALVCTICGLLACAMENPSYCLC